MTKIRPETFFLVIVLAAGILNALLTPLGAGYDEDTHVARIWEMSKGEMIPNRYLSQGPNFPFVFYQLSYRQQLNLVPQPLEAWQAQFREKIDWDVMVPHNTRAVYFPVLYLVQAFIMGVFGRLFDAPVGWIYVLLRLSYLVMYAALAYWAIRLIPFGKWILAVLALAPTAILQASIVSHDGLNNGVSFLFTAWVLHLVVKYAGEPGPGQSGSLVMSNREIGTTLVLVWLVCMLKVTSVLLLGLLFMLPPRVYGSRLRLGLFILAAAVGLVVVFGGWNLLAASDLQGTTPYETDAAQQVRGILAEPVRFVQTLGFTLHTQLTRYLEEWVGVMGFAYWKMPWIVYGLFGVLLLLALAGENSGEMLNTRRRAWLGAVFAASMLAVLGAFYLTFNPVGSPVVSGVQGRYFTSFTPLLFLALVPASPLIKKGSAFLPVGILLNTALALGAVFLVYHVTCGSSTYTPGLCYRPYYKNWSTTQSLETDPSAGLVLRQTFTAECDNLAQVRTWVKDGGSAGYGAVLVTLVEAENSHLVGERIFSGAELSPGSWLEMDVPVQADSGGKRYLFQVAPVNPTQPQTTRLAYSPQDEYPAGKLLLGEQEAAGDLLFQYGCQAGWGE